MHDKPQYSVTLLPGNEVRLLSLSRTAKVEPGELRYAWARKEKALAVAIRSLPPRRCTMA